MLANLRLKHIRLELSRGAYIRICTYGKKPEIGLFKSFYYPFERGVCLGYLTARQFKTLCKSGFVYCDYETSNGDGHFAYYFAGGVDE